MKLVLLFCLVAVAIVGENSCVEGKSVGLSVQGAQEKANEEKAPLLHPSAGDKDTEIKLGKSSSLTGTKHQEVQLSADVQNAIFRHRRDEISDYEGYEP